ncbi:MAG: hypothetical protein EOO24_05810 [Comamonadaceae bacterium]|nr:MAG: hypothetical protein EOO24_05810 [Comamonadaceae bacterium]
MHALQDPVFLRKLGICFLIALASYAFVHGFELTHFTLSIDEEPLDNFGQTLSAGRWGHALLKRHLLPEPYLPFLTMALSLILLSMAAALSAVHLRLDTLRSARPCSSA